MENNKKKYKQPKIKRIQLDAEQAILQVCAVGGVYMLLRAGVSTFWCITATGASWDNCQISAKGVQGTIDAQTFAPPYSNMPS